MHRNFSEFSCDYIWSFIILSYSQIKCLKGFFWGSVSFFITNYPKIITVSIKLKSRLIKVAWMMRIVFSIYILTPAKTLLNYAGSSLRCINYEARSLNWSVIDGLWCVKGNQVQLNWLAMNEQQQMKPFN